MDMNSGQVHTTSSGPCDAQTLHKEGIKTAGEYGLIILGNSGVGKSFLANVLLGREVFVHDFSSSSVTHTTSFEQINIGYYRLAISNVPGLIEAEQKRIDLNKQEIDKAFEQQPDSIIMYVFGQQGGRIREEDVVAFKAIDTAYSFKKESLVLVVNGLPKKRPSNYEGATLVLLQQLLSDTYVDDRNLCFLDFLNDDSSNNKQHLKEQLLKVLVECKPSKHEKKQDIETLIDQLKQQKELIKKQRTQFEAEKEKHMNQITIYQNKINEMNAKHQSEIDSLDLAIKRQEEMYAEQKNRYDEESRLYQTQLQEMHSQLQQAQSNYEQLKKENAATQEEIETARQASDKCKTVYDELANRSRPSPQVIHEQDKKSDCVIC